MRNEKYLFGAAAVGMATAIVLIFNASGSSSASTGETEVASFSVEAQAESSYAETRATIVTEREIRVIHPSPYQGVSFRNEVSESRM